MTMVHYDKTVLPKDELIRRLIAERPVSMQGAGFGMDALEYNTDNWVRT